MIRLKFSILSEIRCLHLGTRSVCKKVNQPNKRGSMLADMIANRDRRKDWYFHILKNSPKSRNVFENVHKPGRRQSALNSLFIQNITDVLSTGDAAAEFIGSGIEITGVKVVPSCKDVMIYWQIPQSKFSENEELSTLLNLKAPKIRAELISRNVMGRVPVLHFVRDTSNAYIAAFEKAMEEADFGPKERASIVPDDTFMKKKNIYVFKESGTYKEKEVEVANSQKTVEKPLDMPPQRPVDMKSDVFGLNQENMMKKIVALKTVHKPSTENKAPSNVIVGSNTSETDLFSKIPGTTIDGYSNREGLLKEFHIQRKILRNKKAPQPNVVDHLVASDCSNEEEHYECVEEEDFIEEDTPERF